MDDTCQKIANFYEIEDCFWRNETEYRSYYKLKILGYLNLTFCVILIISNAFVILVLSKKSVTSSMNTIFTHIAITETLVALGYSPRVCHEFLRVEECAIPQHRKFIWEIVSMGSYKVAFMFRHIGAWLTVMLGVWRYIAVIHPLKERRWCNPEITRKFIRLAYVFGIILTIPPYFAAQVGSAKKLLDNNGCSTANYTAGNFTEIYEPQFPLENYPVLFILALSFYGMVFKVLPSVAFTFISYRLISRIIEMKKQRQSLISQHLDKRTDRTTISLVLILILFVIGEAPHGIFCMLAAYHGPKFLWRVYYYWFEIFNTLTFLSECFNFIIYYTMSHQFRETFKTIIQTKAEALRNIKIFDRYRSFGSSSQETNGSNNETNQIPSTSLSSYNHSY